MKIGEIEIIECNSISEAEAEYFSRRNQGCWQMEKTLKIVWSWRKLRNVFRFSMKKVEKQYHIDDHIRDTYKVISAGLECAENLISSINVRNKAKQHLEKLLNP